MKLKRYINKQLPPEELEQLTQEFVQAKIDDDYRNRWKEKLKKEQGIERTKIAGPKKGTHFKRQLLWRLAAAVLLLVLMAIPTYNFLSGDMQSRVTAMIEADNFTAMHGAKKGVDVNLEKNREEATRLFNQKQYLSASQAYQKLVDDSGAQASDYFFLAYSYLKIGAYPKSEEAFLQARALPAEDGFLREETNWYLSLALLIQGKEEAGKKELRSIKTEEWKYSAAQELLGQ